MYDLHIPRKNDNLGLHSYVWGGFKLDILIEFGVLDLVRLGSAWFGRVRSGSGRVRVGSAGFGRVRLGSAGFGRVRPDSGRILAGPSPCVFNSFSKFRPSVILLKPFSRSSVYSGQFSVVKYYCNMNKSN